MEQIMTWEQLYFNETKTNKLKKTAEGAFLSDVKIQFSFLNLNLCELLSHEKLAVSVLGAYYLRVIFQYQTF